MQTTFTVNIGFLISIGGLIVAIAGAFFTVKFVSKKNADDIVRVENSVGDRVHKNDCEKQHIITDMSISRIEEKIDDQNVKIDEQKAMAEKHDETIVDFDKTLSELVSVLKKENGMS